METVFRIYRCVYDTKLYIKPERMSSYLSYNRFFFYADELVQMLEYPIWNNDGRWPTDVRWEILSNWMRRIFVELRKLEKKLAAKPRIHTIWSIERKIFVVLEALLELHITYESFLRSTHNPCVASGQKILPNFYVFYILYVKRVAPFPLHKNAIAIPI